MRDVRRWGVADLSALRSRLASFDAAIVAFSGGADSSLLAWVAHDTLGDRALAVTAVSPSLAGREHDDCRSLAHEWGMAWLEVHTDEMDNAAYRVNDTDRCYHCKDALMDALGPIASARSATPMLGVNLDDLDDHRPGQRAAAEHGAVFPLVEAGFTKDDVRRVSQELGLRTWDKPAAPCLASRLPYGTPVTLGRLRSIEDAEDRLRAMGFDELRVRHHGDLARIELPLDRLEEATAQAGAITAAVQDAGYRQVTIDPAGLRSGSLNPPNLRTANPRP